MGNGRMGMVGGFSNLNGLGQYTVDDRRCGAILEDGEVSMEVLAEDTTGSAPVYGLERGEDPVWGDFSSCIPRPTEDLLGIAAILGNDIGNAWWRDTMEGVDALGEEHGGFPSLSPDHDGVNIDEMGEGFSDGGNAAVGMNVEVWMGLLHGIDAVMLEGGDLAVLLGG
jgi:hypothetical protein